MQDLIPYSTRQLGGETVNTVNARDLYNWLEIKGDYNLWIKRAIKRANLIEDIDFIIYLSVENSKMGRRPHEHHLTFDAAKQVAMMSSATKGHETRLWFIQKEKELDTLKQQHIQVKNPANQLIIDAIIRLDAVEQQAEAARQEAETAQKAANAANENANRALESQLFSTVAEYVYSNKLQPQIPENAYRECSDYLRLYCMDHRIPFRSIPVGGKPWKEEYGFHSNVYVEALPGWLKRRFSQGTLHILPTPEKEA